ncbi:hypothetical protein BGZ83_005661 [Gryganskiella cystojenkinii]|nr:hypothetical protein BGZ83_005661 [Gryganskiella cystojenkinii]
MTANSNNMDLDQSPASESPAPESMTSRKSSRTPVKSKASTSASGAGTKRNYKEVSGFSNSTAIYETNIQNLLEAILPEGTEVTSATHRELAASMAAIIDEVTKVATSAALAAVGLTRKPTKKASITASEEDEQDELEDSDDEDDGILEQEYEVEKILDHQTIRGGHYQFRIKWKGYHVNQSTWESRDALEGCQEMLKTYAQEKNLTLD